MEDSGNTSDESTSSSKRQKISGDSGNTDEGLDRISVLPDSVLLYILSLLPTKEAIKTGILSKRWAYLWTSVPNLDFSDPNFEESEDEDGFVNFVDRTLILYGGSRIKRFRVVFEYREWFASRVDLWIRFAARKNVEELILEFAEGDNLDPLDGDPYLLPQHVLTNGSVTNLSFSFCRINPHGSISWRSLKSLSLSYMPLNDNLVHDIITGSPSLEVLDLYECCGLRKLNITSENLKKLTLRDYYSSSDLNSALEISAPNIQSLSILGILNRRCHLMNMPSLIDATLQFQIMIDNILDEYNVYEGYHNILRVILETLQHVKVLRIGIWCIQV
nr:TPA_asm: hypothetical protein HUJ06_024510 [Nelumbo nucifera]